MKNLILIILVSMASTVFAESVPVLTLQRVNYKPEKRLVYAVNFDAAKCELDSKNPVEAYYRDNESGERLPEFSEDSEEYFGPRREGVKRSESTVALEFKTLDEINDKLDLNAEILITVFRPSPDKCEPYAEVTYGDKNFVLEHIDLKVRKFLGIPVGADWVRLQGYDSEDIMNECVLGDCPAAE